MSSWELFPFAASPSHSWTTNTYSHYLEGPTSLVKVVVAVRISKNTHSHWLLLISSVFEVFWSGIPFLVHVSYVETSITLAFPSMQRCIIFDFAGHWWTLLLDPGGPSTLVDLAAGHWWTSDAGQRHQLAARRAHLACTVAADFTLAFSSYLSLN